MKFIDRVKSFLSSGKGGAGCAAMRHEKFIEFGGPDGGDGGKGGDVYIKGAKQLTSLQDLRFNPHQKAKCGQPGLGKQKTGRGGEDKVIEVPLGTIVINDETDEILCEVLAEDQYMVLQGGRGGLGNVHFKTSMNRAPRYCQPGEPEQEMTVRMELKVMADVGLVGFPNAGKSTFISSISNARPKIADYPFTTLVPNLGVVSVAGYKSFVVADIPGIIEDAHIGVGLGDQFLKHIQRTSVLAFLLDCSEFTEHEPAEAFKILFNELKQYSADLTEKKRIVLLTKTDALSSKINLEETIEQFKEIGEHAFPISSVARKGTQHVVFHLSDLVDDVKAKNALDEETVMPV